MNAPLLLGGLGLAGLLTVTAPSNALESDLALELQEAVPTQDSGQEERPQPQARGQRRGANGQEGPRRRERGAGAQGGGAQGDGANPAPQEGRGGNREALAKASPLFRTLDKDGDGVLSKAEIDAASASLRSLDQNKDGQLNLREVFRRGRPGAGAGDGQGPGARPQPGPDGPTRRTPGTQGGGAGRGNAGGVTPKRPGTSSGGGSAN